MFLLRRKKDGKFWKNSWISRHWDQEWLESQWTDDISLCRPFKTAHGAMHSRGVWYEPPDRDYTNWYHIRMSRLHDEFEAVKVSVTISVKGK